MYLGVYYGKKARLQNISIRLLYAAANKVVSQ
jgi:hypothetical protein